MGPREEGTPLKGRQCVVAGVEGMAMHGGEGGVARGLLLVGGRAMPLQAVSHRQGVALCREHIVALLWQQEGLCEQRGI